MAQGHCLSTAAPPSPVGGRPRLRRPPAWLRRAQAVGALTRRGGGQRKGCRCLCPGHGAPVADGRRRKACCRMQPLLPPRVVRLVVPLLPPRGGRGPRARTRRRRTRRRKQRRKRRSRKRRGRRERSRSSAPSRSPLGHRRCLDPGREGRLQRRLGGPASGTPRHPPSADAPGVPAAATGGGPTQLLGGTTGHASAGGGGGPGEARAPGPGRLGPSRGDRRRRAAAAAADGLHSFLAAALKGGRGTRSGTGTQGGLRQGQHWVSGAPASRG